MGRRCDGFFGDARGYDVVRLVEFGRPRGRARARDGDATGRVIEFRARPARSDLEIAWRRSVHDRPVLDWRAGTDD